MPEKSFQSLKNSKFLFLLTSVGFFCLVVWVIFFLMDVVYAFIANVPARSPCIISVHMNSASQSHRMSRIGKEPLEVI